MEHINLSECPMQAVDDAVDELKQLAGLCNAMMFMDSGSNATALDAETFVFIMRHLWTCLDAQIKALDGIQWDEKRARAAA